jgi:ADP-heptose:LPS heptosyltransferase
LFEDIERLHFIIADLKGRHKGIAGLYRLKKELQQTIAFDAIADLHNVLRTQIIRRFFAFSNIPIAAIDKGRREKKELTRSNNKVLRSLKSTHQRYADVFAALGLPVDLQSGNGFLPKPMPAFTKQSRLIGIAPFAQYEEKTYPAQKMKEVIRLLAADANHILLLFGGKDDKPQLDHLQQGLPNVENKAGIGLKNELPLLAHLDVMISMDSANMHLASLYGVPVVSVWGGTHPYLGFMGWRQSMENAVQVDLPCRPSSVFGNKACANQLACMHGISPLLIVEKVLQQLTSAL